MKKYYILWMIGLMMCWTVSAQQIPASTIFIENPFAFNPAVAGTSNGFELSMMNRLQWIGFNDAPVTNLLSGFGPHKLRNIGYGGNIIHDQTGPVSTFKMNGAFSSNFVIASEIRASFGLNLGFIQYRADGTQFMFYDDYEDVYAPNIVMSSFQPDAGAGLYVYHSDWYAGFSAQQLFNNSLQLGPGSEKSKRNRLKTHFYGLAGYRFTNTDRQWLIEPSLLLRKVVSLPFQMDVSGRVIYREQFWGGLCARNTFSSFDDLCLLMGYIHQRKIHISIAYDFSFAKIRDYTTGTIELVLGYNFDPHPKKGK